MKGSLTQGAHLIVEAMGIMTKPGYKRFVVIPILVNIFIFIAASIGFIHAYQNLSAYLLAGLPHWLHWLNWLLGPIVGLTFLLIYGYCFNLITNFIAAPFYGLLAEKIAVDYAGVPATDESMVALIPRTLVREVTKLWYFLSRGVLVFLLFLALFLLPGLNLLATLVAALWGCWCLAIQYSDYAADNDRKPFAALRKQLAQQKLTSFGFGALVLGGSMVPLVNILVPPVAVVAGTLLYWRGIHRNKVLQD